MAHVVLEGTAEQIFGDTKTDRVFRLHMTPRLSPSTPFKLENPFSRDMAHSHYFHTFLRGRNQAKLAILAHILLRIVSRTYF